PTEQAEDGVERHLCTFHEVEAAQLNGCLYRRRGRDAVEHLYRVAAGLDSMLLGEAEILGQVRESYLAAQREGHTGPILNRLFQASLEVGKRVRAETRLGAQAMSVPSAAMKLAEQIFGELKDNSAAVFGTGAMGAKAARQLRARGIGRLWVANRTPERARQPPHVPDRSGGAAEHRSRRGGPLQRFPVRRGRLAGHGGTEPPRA